MSSGLLRNHSSRLDATVGGDIGRHTTWAGIGGALDYRVLAELHRPSDPALLKAEICRLADSGLTPMDIAIALRIDPVLVREMLKEKTP